MTTHIRQTSRTTNNNFDFFTKTSYIDSHALIKTEEINMECPKCGRKTLLDFSKCPSCGYDTYEAYEKQKLGLPVEGSPQSDPTKCPYCRGDIEPGVLKCKYCGEWLDREHRAKADQVQKAQIQTGNTAKFIGLMIAIPILLAVAFKMCAS